MCALCDSNGVMFKLKSESEDRDYFMCVIENGVLSICSTDNSGDIDDITDSFREDAAIEFSYCLLCGKKVRENNIWKNTLNL